MRMTEVAEVDTAFNAVIVEGAPGMQAALLALPGVRRVFPDREHRAVVTSVLNTHAVPAAWDKIGGAANAGAGVRIAILDSGIYLDHPAFRAPEGFSMPAGYPVYDIPNSLRNSNLPTRVLVARSYQGGWPSRAFDVLGHGTAVAAAAAASLVESPEGPFSGVAPYSLIGAYKITSGSGGGAPYSLTLQALEDAVRDGMQVINYSYGDDGLYTVEGDPVAEAFNNLVDAGIVVIHAAGNSGPSRMSIGSLSASEKILAVGANQNTSPSSSGLITTDSSEFAALSAVPSSNASGRGSVSGPVVDVVSLGDNGLGCAALPSNSLVNAIALIQRGTCTFVEKLLNAQRAGAIGTIVFNHGDIAANNPDPDYTLSMSTDDSSLAIAGLFIGNTKGQRLREALRDGSLALSATLNFSASGNANLLASFSSLGPSIDFKIKPDMVATGSAFFTAATSADLAGGFCGSLCTSSGYVTTQGTSFSAPVIAGAAAVVKGARPELSALEIRSLLVNASDPMVFGDRASPVQDVGAGRLNLLNALSSTLTADPVSLSFGVLSATTELSRILRVKNVGTSSAYWQLTIESTDSLRPTVSADWMWLPAGETGAVSIDFPSRDLPPGTYQGFIQAKFYREDGSESQPGDVVRIPYWLAMSSGIPARISVPITSTNGFVLRIFDASGIPITDPLPEVTTSSPLATVNGIETSFDMPGSLFVSAQIPGFSGAVFQVKLGDFVRTVTIE